MSEYCKNCFEFAEKLTEKEQECEELKEQDYKNLKIIHSNFNQIKSLRAENTRYRKALEEIEGLVKNFCKDCGDYENCNWDKEGCYYSLIPNLKDIISKAKDGNNV